ncbi:uncharacterized protein [Aquarana catesbeiana]|uniref:uncharacterized protein n=1 Tax=Aquarana catesbeiana TaxID=8400 RepID=UPI003CC9BC42
MCYLLQRLVLGTERGLSAVEDRKRSLLEKLNKYTNSTEKVGSLTIYKMKMEDVKLNKKNKVIMMVGETRSGKTTLINAMINYIFGVDWKDDYRFQLIEESSKKSQAHSQTSSVTMYQIIHEDGFRIPYSITIIDTPGFGDTRGIDHDEKIMQKIRDFFSKCQFTEIDAICFVVQSFLVGLTPTQVYIYDKILSIFGNDIKDNIVFFTTFADVQEPSVLSAITEADVPCAKSKDGKPVYFMINNGMLYANNRPDQVGKRVYKAQEMQWEMGMESIEEFFLQYLPGLASKDLTLTKEVLAKRKALEVILDGLGRNIERVTGKQYELEQTERALNENWEEVKKNENLEYFDIKKKYEKAVKKVMALEVVVLNLKEDIKKAEDRVMEFTGEIAKILKRLQEIALKPNPMSATDYIKLLIEKEKQEGKSGYMERIKIMEENLKEFEYFEKILRLAKCQN